MEVGASDSGTVEGDGASGGSMVDLGLFDRPKMSDITCSWSSDVFYMNEPHQHSDTLSSP